MKTRKMKGISLPIEMIVIIAIAVLVLVVIAAFFVGGAGKLNTSSDIDALGQGCQKWKVQGCPQAVPEGQVPIKGYDPTGAGAGNPNYAGDSLSTACNRLNYVVGAPLSQADSCRRACGCPA